ncbi:MAG: alpha/beta fold hydrolase [Nitriliruptoraceae bacterium]|nr:alpha/beta fold hydrolase [Nitriliruptoraceae bacterium]
MERDWGTRDERWAGIRSEVVEMQGTSVHVLRADGPADGPTHLLVHGLGGSGTNWLEVIGGLAQSGPVIAPDLPGFGRTEPPRPGASRIRANLGFLKAFAGQLGVSDAVVHGNSMGGLLATLLAAERPDLVGELVLVDPALPSAPGAIRKVSRESFLTFAPFVVPGLGRRVVGKWYADNTAEQLFADNQTFVHSDPTRVRPALREVGIANTAYGQRTPWRLDGFVAAGESLLPLLLGRTVLNRAVDAVEAPTLLLWGDHDQLVGRPVIDAVTARRPDFDVHVFEGVGHVPMVEVADDYLEVVTRWRDRRTSAPGPAAAAS